VFDLPAAEGYGFYLVHRPGALDRPRIRAFRDFVMGEARAPAPGPSDRPRR
jgi:DNA-binding transcriptional LysR family regulator